MSALLLLILMDGLKSHGDDLSLIMAAKSSSQLRRVFVQQERQATVKGACDLQRKSHRLTFACTNPIEFEQRCQILKMNNVELAELLKAREIKGLSSACRRRLDALYKIRVYQTQEAQIGPTFERLISHDDRQIFANTYRTGRAHRARR